jgi:tetratricopeptide (TPR) repeat protein
MKRWLLPFLAGAAVTAACLLASPPASAQETEALVAKGRTCLQKGDYAGARDAFLAAAGKDAKSVDARRGAAEALLGLGQSDDAVEQANAGLDLVENKDAGLWLLVARGYLQKGDGLSAQKEEQGISYADARAKASEALKRDPSLVLARVVLAKACRLTDDADRAVGVLEEGLAKSPADFDLLFEMGMVRLRKGEYDAALAAFDGAAAADPKSAEAQYRRGAALVFLKRTEDACKAYAKATVLDTGNRMYLKTLAQFAKDGTVGYLRAILKEKPDYAWAHAYLAYYLAYAKDDAGAIAESKAATALAPEDVDLVAWHGQVVDILGKKQEAIAWYRKALLKNPQTVLAWNKLCEFATAPGSPAKADERKEIIDFIAKVRPDDAIFWNNVGLLYRDTLKDPRRALEAYLKAAALAPNDQGIQNDTGLIYLFHGPSIGMDPKEGVPYFERCLALVREENQSPEMGYRDTLENLSLYYSTYDKNPAKCLEVAKERNDPELWARLPKGLGAFSARAEQARQWAEKELKR